MSRSGEKPPQVNDTPKAIHPTVAVKMEREKSSIEFSTPPVIGYCLQQPMYANTMVRINNKLINIIGET